MNRYLSKLSLLLVVAVGMMLTTRVQAAEAPFALTCNGLSYVSGPMLHYPVLDVSVYTDVTQPGPFGIVREVAQFKLNADMGTVSEGRVAFITSDGDVLYGRIPTGSLCPDPGDPGNPDRFQSVMDYEFVGGTGPFAGVRGTGTSTSLHGHLSPVLVTVEGAVISGTLHFADLRSNMVPVRISEGDPVGEVILEPESYPLIFQEVTHTGLSSHCGTYTNSKQALLEFDLETGQLLGFSGFLTKTVANGDTMDGYFAGSAVPSTQYPGASEVSLQVWILSGTGRFGNVSGREAGGGLIWPDGREDIVLEGMISSVGSSKY